MEKIKIALIGLGNCASALIQGIGYYAESRHKTAGLMAHDIGGYEAGDLEVVCAFDIDARKVGLSIQDAIWSPPNCAMRFNENIVNTQIVFAAPILDGFPRNMNEYPESKRFVPCEDLKDTNVDAFSAESDQNIAELRKKILIELEAKKVEILVNYLPVGSQRATEFWAEICLETGICFLNCIPVFIASDPMWESRFKAAGIPIVGDDMKSEFGSSILSQMLQELALARGHYVKCHIQRNVGGNTDFLNMEDKSRVQSKKISKENVIHSPGGIRSLCTHESFIHAGPSEYIEYYGDNKVANIHMELEGFMGSPVVLDLQLSVQDSPNSAGVVIDAIRYLKVAKELGLSGALRGASAFTQKTPPMHMSMQEAILECKQLAKRQLTPTSSPWAWGTDSA